MNGNNFPQNNFPQNNFPQNNFQPNNPNGRKVSSASIVGDDQPQKKNSKFDNVFMIVLLVIVFAVVIYFFPRLASSKNESSNSTSNTTSNESNSQVNSNVSTSNENSNTNVDTNTNTNEDTNTNTNENSNTNENPVEDSNSLSLVKTAKYPITKMTERTGDSIIVGSSNGKLVKSSIILKNNRAYITYNGWQASITGVGNVQSVFALSSNTCDKTKTVIYVLNDKGKVYSYNGYDFETVNGKEVLPDTQTKISRYISTVAYSVESMNVSKTYSEIHFITDPKYNGDKCTFDVQLVGTAADHKTYVISANEQLLENYYPYSYLYEHDTYKNMKYNVSVDGTMRVTPKSTGKEVRLNFKPLYIFHVEDSTKKGENRYYDYIVSTTSDLYQLDLNGNVTKVNESQLQKITKEKEESKKQNFVFTFQDGTTIKAYAQLYSFAS